MNCFLSLNSGQTDCFFFRKAIFKLAKLYSTFRVRVQLSYDEILI